MQRNVTELTTLESGIRSGESPDQPELLQHYLALSDRQARQQTQIQLQRSLYLRTFRTLLDTICDTCIAYHWRCLCLDHIHQPLCALARLADSASEHHQVKRLQYELRALSQYFL